MDLPDQRSDLTTSNRDAVDGANRHDLPAASAEDDRACDSEFARKSLRLLRHRHQKHFAALTDDPGERVAAVRTLMAEEARLGMMVGVAVGYELARELERDNDEGGTT